MNWVTINKLAEMSGYTSKAIRRKIEDGVFIEGIHWKYSPDHRIQLSVESYEKWVEGQPVTASKRGKQPSASPSSGAGNAAAKH